jgi:hypothetical protein
MKHLTTVILFLTATIGYAQKITTLDELGSRDTIPKGKAVFYGQFSLKRLGCSMGFPNYVRLINLDTKEVLVFRVKTKSNIKNHHCYVIKAGNYAILTYWSTQSKWYGRPIPTEPDFKGIDATDNLEKKIKSGQIKQEDLMPFTFSLTENSLNYVGTWHFDKELVKFSDDKLVFDNQIKDKYKKLDFSVAKTILPN